MTREIPAPVAQVEAYNYKCLQAICQPLERFQLLVGRNGSGKSTFLDTLLFLQTSLVSDVETAVLGVSWESEWFVPRAMKDFRDMLFKGQGNTFTLAVVFNLPEQVQIAGGQKDLSRCRYQVQIGVSEAESEEEEIQVLREGLWLLPVSASPNFGRPPSLPLDGFEDKTQQSYLWQPERRTPLGWREVIRRQGRRAYLTAENSNWQINQPMSPTKLTLSILDEERFPAASWVAQFLQEDVLALQLNPRRMRTPCPATASENLDPDGANLPKVVDRFARKSPEQFRRWVRTVQGVSNDLQEVEVRRREEDNALYLVLRYKDYEVKQWSVSEGTLRLLALTLLGYLPEKEPKLWIIEEPENGVHPQALEYIIQSLATSSNAQFLIATHSPVVLGFKDYITPRTLLCFRQEGDASRIQRGTDLIQEGELSLGRMLEWGML
jgi:predicted ATPase/uncharacterized protein YbdZ (MbtH family)